jgi:hypothetical protein
MTPTPIGDKKTDSKLQPGSLPEHYQHRRLPDTSKFRTIVALSTRAVRGTSKTKNSKLKSNSKSIFIFLLYQLESNAIAAKLVSQIQIVIRIQIPKFVAVPTRF